MLTYRKDPFVASNNCVQAPQYHADEYASWETQPAGHCILPPLHNSLHNL